MDGFKLIKTIFGNKKEIVGVDFNGDESYYLFIKEVKQVYELPEDCEVQVYSKEFVIKPNIFLHFVAQYISNLDFILDIKISNTPKPSTAASEDVSENSSALDLKNVRQIIKTPEVSPTQLPSIWDTQKLCCIVPNTYVNHIIPTTLEIKQISGIVEYLSFKTLENKHRTRIAKAIITLILTGNPDRRLLRDEFLQLAQSIVEIFPFEVQETYYVPFTKGHLAKGKLYDAYNNTRARLSATGIIQRRIRSKSQPTVITDESNILSDTEVDECQLEILRSGCVAWDLVLETWARTHYYRMNEFKTENFDAFEYMERYKVLQNEKNYELFDIDFKMAYPSAKGINEWKLYHHKIIDKAEKLRDNSVRQILMHVESASEEDSKLALSLLLIPYILSSSRQRSKSDIQESFISYSRDIVKEELEDDDDEAYCSAKRLKLDNLPKVSLIPDSYQSNCFAYLDLLGRRHYFQNPLQAIEACFHCFISMNIKYPKSCEHVWLFVQKLIFQITTENEIVVPSINTLINDLQK